MGLTVPDEISLMGFDNVELSALIHPPLTTINQPKYEMGQAAVEMLVRHSKSPRPFVPEQRVLGVNLVERKSCRAL
jgi:DNA-binding LacI/PurR family transcriptional regulator